MFSIGRCAQIHIQTYIHTLAGPDCVSQSTPQVPMNAYIQTHLPTQGMYRQNTHLDGCIHRTSPPHQAKPSYQQFYFFSLAFVCLLR